MFSCLTTFLTLSFVFVLLSCNDETKLANRKDSTDVGAKDVANRLNNDSSNVAIKDVSDIDPGEPTAINRETMYFPTAEEMATRLNVDLKGKFNAADAFDPKTYLCKRTKEDFWAGNNTTDVTFLSFGDTQIRKFDAVKAASLGEDFDRVNDLITLQRARNNFMIEALNSVENQDWPTRFTNVDPQKNGAKVNGVRGVLIAGDLTESSYINASKSDEEVKEFDELFPLCGNKTDNTRLKWPTYEGFGNHDFLQLSKEEFEVRPASDDTAIEPAIQLIVERNQHRQGILSKHTHGHYSWQWDDVHFVNLNLMVTDTDQEPIGNTDVGKGIRPINAFKSLTFLDADLEQHVGNSGRPIVIMMHYPINFGGRHSQAEKLAFNQFLLRKNYNVIAILHGHTHRTNVRVLELEDTNLGKPNISQFLT